MYANTLACNAWTPLRYWTEPKPNLFWRQSNLCMRTLWHDLEILAPTLATVLRIQTPAKTSS